MDRTAWIAIIFCAIGLVAWEWWLAKHPPPRPSPVTTSGSPTPTAVATPNPVPTATIPTAAAPSATPASNPAGAPAFGEKTETLRNDDVEIRLTNRGGGIAEAVLLNHLAQGNERVTLNAKDQVPIGTIVEKPEAPALDEFTLSRDSDGSFKCERTANNLAIRKKFFFPPSKEKKDNFLIEMDVDLANTGAQPYSAPAYFVALGSAAPIHPRDYPYYTRLVWCVDGKSKGVDVNWFGGGNGLFGIGARAPQPFYQQDLANTDWAAVSDQFFTTLIAPLTAKANGVWGKRFEISRDQKTFGLAGALRMPGFQLPPGQTYSAKFEIWAGPKIYHRLARLDHNEAEIMDFGIFKIVSQFLLNFLNWLHGFIGSYGWSILVLTAIVKIVLWPLQNKANLSMRRMSLLNPKIQELRDKYKDDPTRMNQEVMKLYKDYGINPIGGCLPMLIQIPIFFGLFKMLGQAVELRNSHFFWVKDLSQPDTVAYLPVIGWPVNIIPLCMAATQIWLMAMTPKTGDPTQRRVMMFTPLIFLFICYNFAAALALYYTAQNLFSIVQFYYNKRQPMPTLEKRAPAEKRK
ncbi:MAG TPA: membrane protein insertase YidC [Chthoniobacterales bacterium]|jgi:YidC/Oxa1 family membrane protein insertase|nr:membrane protein insertase YidC [Chthoniobacterales bacterium]